jgi:hypothetical protein
MIIISERLIGLQKMYQLAFKYFPEIIPLINKEREDETQNIVQKQEFKRISKFRESLKKHE